VARVDVGDIAPDFDLPVTGGGSYRLSDHRGRWVVLAFYPGDFTAVCTRQFIDPQGVVRHRHVALLGLRYRDADQLERALKDARSDYAPA
jgi:peroxiredoxin